MMRLSRNQPAARYRWAWLPLLLAAGCHANSSSHAIDVPTVERPDAALAPAVDAAPVAEVDTSPAPPPAPPPPSDGRVSIDLVTLTWPEDTVSLEFRKTDHISLWPSKKAPMSAKIESGTRVAFTRVVAGEDGKRGCQTWAEIVPSGWICTKSIKPSSEAPGGTVYPVISPGDITPVTYYRLADDGVPAYKTEEDIRTGTAAGQYGTNTKFRPGKRINVDGVNYVKTHVGYVEASVITPMSPSNYVGMDLRTSPPPAWPFAFVLPDSRGANAVVRDDANRKAKSVGKRARRTLVPIGVERDGYVEVAPGEWLDRTQLRVITKQARPPSVAAGAQWIDIDLDEQTLVAYEGDTPIYATLVSTAKRIKNTPPATYLLRSKAASTRMAAELGEANQYDIGEVPWAMRFMKGLFLHAAFWHDNFGNRQSAGCVNLSPRDARFMYEWTKPVMPAGYSELEIPLTDALVIRVRDSKALNPPVYDYNVEKKSRYTADDFRDKK